MLKASGINNFSLVSNNPEKVKALKKANFNFDVLQVAVTPTEQNQQYLSDKIKFGHHTLKFN
jgi:GTP cyclohydrolase II